MTTDRELLELAAKAADIDYAVDEDDEPIRYGDGGYRLGWAAGAWNPLTDDGDRYRLAKKLGIHLHFLQQYVTYGANGIAGIVRWPEDEKNDAYAIVRAAAVIGKSMP